MCNRPFNYPKWKQAQMLNGLGKRMLEELKNNDKLIEPLIQTAEKRKKQKRYHSQTKPYAPRKHVHFNDEI